MLWSMTIKGFKSVVEQTIELGRVNLFVGANGAGKSVVLEAIGVLGAAADGRVDDASLLRRGVRPGVPALYKNAFAEDAIPRFIILKSRSSATTSAFYEVALDNPISRGGKPWRFSHEKVGQQRDSEERVFVSRAPAGATFRGAKGATQRFTPRDPNRGIADVPNPLGDPPDAVREFLSRLRQYAIYDPQTPVLRGIQQEVGPLDPLGIHGGRLAEAVSDVLPIVKGLSRSARTRFFELLGWAKSYGVAAPTPDLVSPAIPVAKKVVTFTDRFMRSGRNRLSAYDASEGALYVLFAFVLLHHPRTPPTFAIENIDHALHPRLARGLIDLLVSQAKAADKQLLLTTHNPLVLDGLDLEDEEVRLFMVDRNRKGHTLVRRLQHSVALKSATRLGLSLSQMWTRGLIGGVPNIT